VLEKLLADQIRAHGQKNVLQGKAFADKLEEAITRYQSRALTTVQVIEHLIELAREINDARPPDGMSDEEYALY
jgi:type I restriction enzyme, R subunit